MTQMTYCEMNIKLIHSEVIPSTVDAVTESTMEYSLLDFNSDQLDVELEIHESITVGNNVFKLTIWNVPSDTLIEAEDQVVLKIWWRDDPYNFMIYSGIVETVTIESDNQDAKLVIEGYLLQDYILNVIKPFGYGEVGTNSLKVTTIEDFKTAVKTVGIKDVELRIPNFTSTQELDDHFLLDGQSTVKELIIRVGDSIQRIVGKKIIRQYRNWSQSIIFKVDLDADKSTEVLVHALDSGDVFSFTQEGSESIGEIQINFKTTGLVGFTYGEVFAFNKEFYVTDDVIHTYSISAGYISEIFAHRYVDTTEETET